MPRKQLPIMYNFTFRCEIASDLSSLFESIIDGRCCVSHFKELSFDNKGMGGCTVQVTTELPMNKLILFMQQVEDGHRMIQTLNNTTYYTGEMIR